MKCYALLQNNVIVVFAILSFIPSLYYSNFEMFHFMEQVDITVFSKEHSKNWFHFMISFILGTILLEEYILNYIMACTFEEITLNIYITLCLARTKGK
jgi:hypothetical protein